MYNWDYTVISKEIIFSYCFILASILYFINKQVGGTHNFYFIYICLHVYLLFLIKFSKQAHLQ